jgi:hypothetical protein
MVENGLDNQVLAGLGVEKQGVELLEDMLNRQGHITVASRQIEVVLRIGIQLALDGAADVLIEHFVLMPFDDDAFYQRFVDFQLLGQKLYAVGFFFSGDKQQCVAFFIVFLGEKIGRQRVAFVYDIDNGF